MLFSTRIHWGKSKKTMMSHSKIIAAGGSSFCSFADTRLPAADLEPETGGEADTP